MIQVNRFRGSAGEAGNEPLSPPRHGYEHSGHEYFLLRFETFIESDLRNFGCKVALGIGGARVWVALVVLLSAPATSRGGRPHRRSMASQTTLPLSKGGWRPVINSGLPGYGAFSAAPLHAPSYKYQDSYQSSSRPVATRDATKLTSIAQSYRPTTLRTLPASSTLPQNQPINSYLNPFSVPNNGLSHFKIVQNFPGENVVIRNPHNPYAARPTFSKFPTKQQLNKQFQNNAIQQFNNQQFNNQQFNNQQQYNGNQFANQQQLSNQHQLSNQQQFNNQQQLSNQQQLNNQQQYNNQQQLSNHQYTPYQFAVPLPGYQTQKPQDVFGKPIDKYVRPTDAGKRPQSAETEIYKPEVYKVDSDTAPQSINQQHVRTAQQQQAPGSKPTGNTFSQYPDKFAPLPPSILGTFSSYGVQSVKGREPVFPPTRATFASSGQPSKTTIFNSFSFAPYFKSTPTYFPQTTPKFQTTLNQIHFGTTVGDYKATPTQPPKLLNSVKADPLAASKPNFKPSPQDPFAKFPGKANKIQASTYNPSTQTTTAVNSYFIQNFNDHQVQHNQGYYNQQPNFSYENKKHKIHDSISSSVNQQAQAQAPDPPRPRLELEATQNSLPVPATYEVTENYESDDVTHNSWQAITDTYEQKPASGEQVPKDELSEGHGKPSTTTATDLPEEYAIVTEGDKGYENSLSYDTNVEAQSRRPLGDDFEPIGKHKLKDYYYRVSTPSHDEFTTHHKRKPRPTEATTSVSSQERDVTTHYVKATESPAEALPTLPPNKHFKRPNPQDPIDKDKIRKRNKNRRRRPPAASANNDKEETSTRKYQYSTEPTTTEAEDHTIKPRVRVHKNKGQNNLTTPTISTDLSTSALPTTSPTAPTIVRKKISHRRPGGTTERLESTTTSYTDFDSNKESPIMKIASRPHHPRVTTITFDYKPTETPDYSHKQDEKDTPTSDVSIGITESLRNKPDSNKSFSFHKDVKPIEAKLEPLRQGTTTTEGRADNTEEASEFTTTTPKDLPETTPGKVQRPRPKNKYENNRPKFSVKDYRNRLSSTTTTEKPTEASPAAPKIRFPQRRLPFENRNNSDNETERKKFIPKDARHKSANSSDGEAVTEKEVVHSTRHPQRRYSSTTESSDATQKISSRIRSGSRRPRPTEETTEALSPPTTHKRPLRKKIKDSEIGESVQDVAVTETTIHYETVHETSERSKSESAIMKIAKDDKKHLPEALDHIFEHSKRVSDLTLAASKDYNTPGMFKTVSPNSRRIPNYFTIATDDPILPIEAFFPQLNGKKES
ncbi:unnamed protein product [Plutella xylostella]|uniref:(diamondback moth) hypothetical protein n=1 Tax=Plutella xylostella TaxID=51655 RepID=A0A8S4G266_PLUXY|nr:unnamed protein product [Plutella xylostella]